MVIVYVVPNSMWCHLTKKLMKKFLIEHQVINVIKDSKLMSTLQKEYEYWPVVKSEDFSWDGYRPELIKKLYERRES